ncbi:DUF2637 domain-containing protein [Streptomyces roseicoloratus]|uniref:DUF2637 domain-containing protein n=1 Tax=Streptomyces roseicoloratus TaxID=2508722 RepID=A0ABY9RWE3_9ACTN|nr:DUF2637 domain-containing protein [Streptomyces roseicoloratus]WMX46496.1 DUF2637 domain-containing protein [Streptomyces roseicoloratus]
MAAMQLTRTHRILIGMVVAGAVIIAGIGFAGSYAAVRELAVDKGFGTFSYFFPIGIDAGICVLLALDLLLTWIRIPFPLLRQTAWVLTAATIAFNGAAAWPDPLGVGMHAVIPVLFVVAVEAARHAVGRIADITADKHMEGVRLTRWLLSPIPTFRLWRRMKLWELRSYEQVIKLEQDRLIYQARLQARFGRAWRRKAPVEALMPLRLAHLGVPLSETALAGLAAAGIEPVLLPPSPPVAGQGQGQVQGGVQVPAMVAAGATPELEQSRPQGQVQVPGQIPGQGQVPGQPMPGQVVGQGQVPGQPGPGQPGPQPMPQSAAEAAEAGNPWFLAQQVSPEAYQGTYAPQIVEGLEPIPVPIPQGPDDVPPPGPEQFEEYQEFVDEQPSPDEFADAAYKAMWDYVEEKQEFPNSEQLDIWLSDTYGITHPRSSSILRELTPQLRRRIEEEWAENNTP